VLLVALLLVGMLFIIYTKPARVEVSIVENYNQVAIEDLIQGFQVDEQKANKTYIEKVIEVEGVVKEISFMNNRHTVLLKSNSFSQSFVMCDMSPLQNNTINELVQGDTVVLRGVCKGYLLDVIMLNCIPINEKTK